MAANTRTNRITKYFCHTNLICAGEHFGNFQFLMIKSLRFDQQSSTQWRKTCVQTNSFWAYVIAIVCFDERLAVTDGEVHFTMIGVHRVLILLARLPVRAIDTLSCASKLLIFSFAPTDASNTLGGPLRWRLSFLAFRRTVPALGSLICGVGLLLDC